MLAFSINWTVTSKRIIDFTGRALHSSLIYCYTIGALRTPFKIRIMCSKAALMRNEALQQSSQTYSPTD